MVLLENQDQMSTIMILTKQYKGKSSITMLKYYWDIGSVSLL